MPFSEASKQPFGDTQFGMVVTLESSSNLESLHLDVFLLSRTVKDILPEAETKQGVLMKNFVAGTIGGTFGTILNVSLVYTTLN